MAHTSTENLSPAERNFVELVQRGDDFFKIELLHHAKNCYKRALELNMETEKISQKLSDCNKKLAFERKVTFILIGLVIITISIYMIL